MKNQTTQFLKRRKFLLILPLLALPFITLAFWALGGGKAPANTVQDQQQGLNSELPGAKISVNALDKMSIYNQARKDSLAFMEQLKGDPYAVSRDDPQATNPYDTGFAYGQMPLQGAYQSNTYVDPNEQKVIRKLEQLERSINEPAPYNPNNKQGNTYEMGAELDRLERMMQAMNNGSGSDPEIDQLNGMLENLLDIQNPGRAEQKLREISQKNKGRVYGVSRKEEQSVVGGLGKGKALGNSGSFIQKGNTFYSLDEPPSFADTLLQIAIPAVVHETQTLVSGATIKMRLSEDVFINGVQIPSGTFISGTCNINGERLAIQVTAVRYDKHFFPVALNAYDPDAIEGIRIPGAINRDAAKDGVDRSLQSIQFMNLNPSMGAQAAGAGVEVAKGLFGKKAKLVRVTVKAGHPLLLLDTKSKQSF